MATTNTGGSDAKAVQGLMKAVRDKAYTDKVYFCDLKKFHHLGEEERSTLFSLAEPLESTPKNMGKFVIHRQRKTATIKQICDALFNLHPLDLCKNFSLAEGENKEKIVESIRRQTLYFNTGERYVVPFFQGKKIYVALFEFFRLSPLDAELHNLVIKDRWSKDLCEEGHYAVAKYM